MKKRILSIVMALAMVLSLMPTALAAEEDSVVSNSIVTANSEEALQKAIDDARGETTIKLNAEIEVNNKITISADKNIVLDLDGNTLSAAKTGMEVINNSGELTVKNGTVAASSVGADYDMAVVNQVGASLIVAQDKGMETKLIGRSAIENHGEVIVNNGTIESFNRNAYWGFPESTLTVNDGTFTSPSGSSGYGRAVSSEGDVTIHGGTFYSGGSSGAGDNYVNAIGMFNSVATLVIEPTNGKNVVVTSETDYAVSSVSGAQVYIHGGTFACNGSRPDVLILRKGNTSLIEISGGTFKHEPYAEYLADNHIALEEDGNYVVKEVKAPTDAAVNSYAELANVLGGSILEPKNITLGADMTIPADADLNLMRGYTLTVPAGITLTVDGILRLNGTMINGGTLTVEDSGFIEQPLHLYNQGTITGLPQDMSAEYVVSTPMQLQWLSYMVEHGQIPANTHLACDLVMPAGVSFTPIGNSKFYADATFDGGNHTISNMNVEVTTEYKGGLFGFVGGGTIKNLTISGTSTGSTSGYIGALIGYIDGNCTVQNVHIKDYTVESPISYGVGGFVGQIGSQTPYRIEFIGCTAENLNVSGYANVGGIWGTSTGATATIGIYNCALSGEVNTIGVNGGICGGYGASAKVEIIGLDNTKLDMTGKSKDSFVAYTDTGADNQLNADASQFTAVKDENGVWVAKATDELAAMVSGVAYADLSVAITAAQAGDTVTLLKKYEGAPVVISKSITVDLGTTDSDETLFTAGDNYQKTTDGAKLIFGLKTFTVTFQTNGGSSVDEQIVAYNGTVTKPADPSRSGYNFAGWYADEAFAKAYDFNASVTEDLTLYAKWSAVSTGGSSSGSSGNKTETTTNPDGSTTTTVTKPDGSKTETTKYPDGSKEVVETKKDGTTTTTTTDKEGNKTETVEKPDGSSVTKVENKDGSGSTTTVSKDGETETTVRVPRSMIEEAGDDAVQLPMPEAEAAKDANKAPSITVDLPSGETAKVEIPVKDVTAGTVAILVKEDGTEEIIKATVMGENGVIVTLSDGDTVKIVDNSKDFADVSDSAWYADAIDFVTSRELFNGTSDTMFSPGVAMTRGMIVTVLARLDGEDTTDGATWYEAGRQWAMENGISDGSNMMNKLTREQLVTMLYRYAQYKGLDTATTEEHLTSFADAAQVSGYAVSAMNWAVGAGVINGTDSGLAPKATATRAEVAQILMNFDRKF